jgi:cell division control protein 42
MSCCNKKFPGMGYVPTIFDHFTVTFPIPDDFVELTIYDTAGQEGYDQLRALGYDKTDVFLICFSVDSPASFENVKDIWLREIRTICPKTPIVLVGNKIDVREDRNVIRKLENNRQRMITKDDGLKKVKEIGAVSYVECSALTREGLEQVFLEAVMIAVNNHGRNKNIKFPKNCQLL